MLTTTEKIKVLKDKRKTTFGNIADATNQSRQNLSNKIARGNFSEEELRTIANVLNCDLEIKFIMRDTGEEL